MNKMRRRIANQFTHVVSSDYGLTEHASDMFDRR